MLLSNGFPFEDSFTKESWLKAFLVLLLKMQDFVETMCVTLFRAVAVLDQTVRFALSH